MALFTSSSIVVRVGIPTLSAGCYFLVSYTVVPNIITTEGEPVGGYFVFVDRLLFERVCEGGERRTTLFIFCDCFYFQLGGWWYNDKRDFAVELCSYNVLWDGLLCVRRRGIVRRRGPEAKIRMLVDLSICVKLCFFLSVILSITTCLNLKLSKMRNSCALSRCTIVRVTDLLTDILPTLFILGCYSSHPFSSLKLDVQKH